MDSFQAFESISQRKLKPGEENCVEIKKYSDVLVLEADTCTSVTQQQPKLELVFQTESFALVSWT